jgi:hypothetical protein
MRSRDLVPTTTAYCFLIAAATSNFRLRRADEMLSEMHSHGMLLGHGSESMRVCASVTQLVRCGGARAARERTPELRVRARPRRSRAHAAPTRAASSRRRCAAAC